MPKPLHRRKKPTQTGSPSPVPPTDWDKAGQWYDKIVGSEGSEYHRQIVLPGAMRLLAASAGQQIIDIACGQGVLCRQLAQTGVHVTGIDAAHSLIAAAKVRQEADPQKPTGRIEYHVADARDLSFLKAERFDAAACTLAIQNIHPLGPVFSEVARLLAPGGHFVMVMMHPCFRGTKETSWGWDAARQVQYRRVDRYLIPRKSPIVTHPGSDQQAYTWTFHRPIEQYVRQLRTAGLLVDAMEEWASHKTSEPGARAAAENRARKEIPLFMAIRAIKTNNH